MKNLPKEYLIYTSHTYHCSISFLDYDRAEIVCFLVFQILMNSPTLRDSDRLLYCYSFYVLHNSQTHFSMISLRLLYEPLHTYTNLIWAKPYTPFLLISILGITIIPLVVFLFKRSFCKGALTLKMNTIQNEHNNIACLFTYAGPSIATTTLVLLATFKTLLLTIFLAWRLEKASCADFCLVPFFRKGLKS